MLAVEVLIWLGLLCIIYFVSKIAFWAGKHISKKIDQLKEETK
jgi:hypothetical protein